MPAVGVVNTPQALTSETEESLLDRDILRIPTKEVAWLVTTPNQKQMIKDLEKHITLDKPDIDWRFDHNKEVLKKLKVVDKQTGNFIWERLKVDNFITDYALNKHKFEIFETIEFADNYKAVTNRLKELRNTDDKIVLTWFSAQQTLLTDWKTFTDNWDDFFYPSSDDLVVINETWDCMIYIAHFESFQLGRGIKTE